MDAPTLLVTGPTLNRPFPQQRVSHTKNYPSKDSSENAIFSIYSMYGDDFTINPRASTSYVAGNDPSLSPTLERQSLIPCDGHGDDSELAYYSTTDSAPPPLISISNSKNGSPRDSVATSSSRPPSSYAAASSIRAHSDLFEDIRSPNLRTSDLSASSYTRAPSKECMGDGSLHSKRSYRSSPPSKERSIQDLPPLPPSRRATPSPTPLLQPSSPHLPSKSHIVPPLCSLSSNVSLVPSEGEDVDAFHVRNTYAQLEASGVKGDGYEEGIERTRARIGTSRKSQMQADAALGDGKDKARDLDDKEIQFLKSVDRCVFSTNISHSLISKKINLATDSFLFLLMTDSFFYTLHLFLNDYLIPWEVHRTLHRMHSPSILCPLSLFIPKKPPVLLNGHA